jgi:hypothetical protein
MAEYPAKGRWPMAEQECGFPLRETRRTSGFEALEHRADPKSRFNDALIQEESIGEIPKSANPLLGPML